MSGAVPDGDDLGGEARALATRLCSRLPARERHRWINRLSADARAEMLRDWSRWAHEGQAAPPGDWRAWLIRAGRGFGKTRAGAEWAVAAAMADGAARVALVGHTLNEARGVMVEGPSGVLAVARDGGERPRWRRTDGRISFANGALMHVYSAEAPESLRGAEHSAAWADELGKWRGVGGIAAWDNLLLGLRLDVGAASRPRVVVTTTPRPTMLMRRVMAMPDCVQTVGATRANVHLAPGFVAAVEAQYGGTRLGRQELDGEMPDEVAGALWTRAMLEAARVAPAAVPAMVRTVVGVDPPAGSFAGDGTGGDACGIVAAGRDRNGTGYVLEDASVTGLSPEGWAHAAAACAARWNADRVVVEVNQGGRMVDSVFRAAGAGLPGGVGLAVSPVRAVAGKGARAEPVALLYERGRVRHGGVFAGLEDELCGFSAGGGWTGAGRSPDRADACVWALTELMLGARAEAGVRVV